MILSYLSGKTRCSHILFVQCLRRSFDFSLILYRLEKKLVDIREEKLALEKQENEQKKRRAEKVNVFAASFDAVFRIRLFFLLTDVNKWVDNDVLDLKKNIAVCRH